MLRTRSSLILANETPMSKTAIANNASALPHLPSYSPPPPTHTPQTPIPLRPRTFSLIRHTNAQRIADDAMMTKAPTGNAAKSETKGRTGRRLPHSRKLLEVYALLSSAQLSSAQLSSAQLSSAQLSSAQLSSAQLSSAQLSSAQLSSAQLSSAQLNSAQLSSAQLSYRSSREH